MEKNYLAHVLVCSVSRDIKNLLKQKGNGAGRVQLFQLVYLVKGGKTATWLAKVVGRKTLYLRDD